MTARLPSGEVTVSMPRPNTGGEIAVIAALLSVRSYVSLTSPTSTRSVAAFCSSSTPKTISPPPLLAIAATSFGKSVFGTPLAGGSADFQSRSSVSATPAVTAASSRSLVNGPGATPSAR